MVPRASGGRRRRHAAADLPYLALSKGRRHLGFGYTGRLGIRHRQLCVVDRYRSCWNADLRHPAAVQADLAQLNQPLCGGHDDLRRGLRRHVPSDPRRPPLAGILAFPLSELHERVAAVPLAAIVGRLRGLDVRHDLGGLLVHRDDPRSWYPARPRKDPCGAVLFRPAGARLARFRAALDAL